MRRRNGVRNKPGGARRKGEQNKAKPTGGRMHNKRKTANWRDSKGIYGKTDGQLRRIQKKGEEGIKSVGRVGEFPIVEASE